MYIEGMMNIDNNYFGGLQAEVILAKLIDSSF